MRLLSAIGLASLLISLQVGCRGAARERPATSPVVRSGPAPIAVELTRQGPAPFFVEPTPLPDLAQARLGHLGERVTVLAFSADGGTVAATNSGHFVGIDAAVHLWDTATGKHLHGLLAHKTYVTCVAFSPDGKQLATGGPYNNVGQDTKLFFWDAQTGKVKDPNGLKFPHHVSALEFTSDSKNLLVGGDEVYLIDAEKRAVLKSVSLPDSSYRCAGLRLAPDGQHLATIGTFGVAYWKMPELELVSKLPRQKGYIEPRTLAFTPDGKDLLLFAHQERSLWRWNVKAGKPGEITRQPLPAPENVARPMNGSRPFAFTPDARRCVHVHADFIDDGDRHVLIVSDTADLKEIRRIESPCFIESLLISPDGKTLAAGGTDGSLRLWELETGKLKRLLLEAQLPIVSMHPAGKNLITLTDDGVLHTWDLSTRLEQDQVKLVLPPFQPLKRLSHDGKSVLMVESDGTLHLWDMQQGKKLWSAAKALAITPPRPPISRGPRRETDKKTGMELLTPEQKRRDEIYDKKTPPDVRIEFAPDDRWVIGRTELKQITLWDTATGQVRHRLATDAPVQAWALARDGKTIFVALSESKSESALVLDVASGKTLRTVPLPPPPKPNSPKDELRIQNYPDLLALAPDGNMLAVVEKTVVIDPFGRPSDSRQIRIWDLIMLEQIDHIRGLNSGVMAFSPDSKRLAFGCVVNFEYFWDGIGIWERSTRTVTKVPVNKQSAYLIAGLSFQSDGKTLAAISTRGINHPPRGSVILLWDTDALLAKQKPAGK